MTVQRLWLSVILLGLGWWPALALNVRDGFDPATVGTEEYLSPAAQWPRLSARAALLFDANAGTVLYRQNDQTVVSPASMTKLFTMALVFRYLASQHIQLEETIRIDPPAYAQNAPPRSSLMFLGRGQRCTWGDLLYGLAVCSGNDAAVAAALNVAGDVPTFVRAMNELAQGLGLKDTILVEPSGYDAGNRTTVHDFAYFVYWYLRTYPQALTYHRTRTFTYPRPENLPPGSDRSSAGISQKNKNALLFDYEGVDGLKTGFIDESGYNIALSAEQGGLRLAGVIMGSKTESDRLTDARRLLDHAFRSYVSVVLKAEVRGTVRVFGAAVNRIEPGTQEFRTVIPRSFVNEIKPYIRLTPEIQGPISATAGLGTVEFRTPETLVARVRIRSAQAIPAASSVEGWLDDLYLGLREVLGARRPPRAEE